LAAISELYQAPIEYDVQALGHGAVTGGPAVIQLEHPELPSVALEHP